MVSIRASYLDFGPEKRLSELRFFRGFSQPRTTNDQRLA